MKISHRPLSKRLRIWQRRPSQRLKSPTTDTRRAFGAQSANSTPSTPSCIAELRAEPFVELAMGALEQEMIVDLRRAPDRRRRRPRSDSTPARARHFDTIARPSLSSATRASKKSPLRRSSVGDRRAIEGQRPHADRVGHDARGSPSRTASDAGREWRTDLPPAPKRWRRSGLLGRARSRAFPRLPLIGSRCRQNPTRGLNGAFHISLRIFRDGAVGRKPADIRGIDDARAQPRLALAPAVVDIHLRLPIGVEIGADHEVIVML